MVRKGGRWSAEDRVKPDWQKEGGLLPAVVQDATTLQVLMVGYMNEEALKQTEASGKVTFFSRSKGRLWVKGETSGNFLNFVSATMDCDRDALLILAKPVGPTCHRETTSCFGDARAPGVGFINRLNQVIEDRYRTRPEGSYTTKLFERGVDRMAQKVGEEAVEVVIAAKNGERTALQGEAADLIYHLLVLLRGTETSFDAVVETLRERHRTEA
jgi:phosphoribosyl-AMP cyclohydrolase / phosphoribosyl-ATP pyrophosphohydrolase